MAKVIFTLRGYSGSKVELIELNSMNYVRKTGDVSRNLERIDSLKKLGLPFPKIYSIDDDSYIMEYIENQDMKSYLNSNNIKNLSNFLYDTILKLSSKSQNKDYTNTYIEKLKKIKWVEYKLPFSQNQLVDKLPKILPCSEYHGDFTLDNILYNESGFFLIDPLTSEYDSYVFDLAKLRQDLSCGWFIRYDNLFFDSKFKILSEKLNKFNYFSNDYLLILMLLRILPYSKNDYDKKFIEKKIEKLWK